MEEFCSLSTGTRRSTFLYGQGPARFLFSGIGGSAFNHSVCVYIHSSVHFTSLQWLAKETWRVIVLICFALRVWRGLGASRIWVSWQIQWTGWQSEAECGYTPFAFLAHSTGRPGEREAEVCQARSALSTLRMRETTHQPGGHVLHSAWDVIQCGL